MARILALDYGVKRTGIAVTDMLQLIASGLTTVPTSELMDFLKKYVFEESVSLIVIGEPKQMNNIVSESEFHIQGFLNELKNELPQIEVVRVDERFTSKIASRTMLEGGLKKKKRRDKGLIDQISATIILQSYLDTK